MGVDDKTFVKHSLFKNIPSMFAEPCVGGNLIIASHAHYLTRHVHYFIPHMPHQGCLLFDIKRIYFPLLQCTINILIIK